jgi:hypothetical protein
MGLFVVEKKPGSARTEGAERVTRRVAPCDSDSALAPLGESVDRDGAFTIRRGPGEGVRCGTPTGGDREGRP